MSTKYVIIIEGTAPNDLLAEVNKEDKFVRLTLPELERAAKLLVYDLQQDGQTISVASIKFPGNTGDKVDLLAARATGEDLDQFGGLADTLLKNLLGRMTFAFDRKKFIKHPEFKKAVHSIAIAAKDAASLPADLDDVAIDQIVMLLDGIIDQQQLSGPLEVGATPDQIAQPRKLRRIHSRQEVIDAIVAAGGDPTDERKFNPAILLLLQYLPNLIEFIMKLIGK